MAPCSFLHRVPSCTVFLLAPCSFFPADSPSHARSPRTSQFPQIREQDHPLHTPSSSERTGRVAADDTHRDRRESEPFRSPSIPESRSLKIGLASVPEEMLCHSSDRTRTPRKHYRMARRTICRISPLVSLSGDMIISSEYSGNHSTPNCSARRCHAVVRGISLVEESSAIVRSSSSAEESDFAFALNRFIAIVWIGISIWSRSSPQASLLIVGAISARTS